MNDEYRVKGSSIRSKRAETLHHNVYNQGSMSVQVADDRRSCVIHLSVPVIRDIDMYISAGFYLGAARHLGARELRCEASMRGNGASFRLSWV